MGEGGLCCPQGGMNGLDWLCPQQKGLCGQVQRAAVAGRAQGRG